MYSITDAAHLGAVLDVVAFVEAEVAQVVRWRSFAGFAGLRGQAEVWEMVRQSAQAVHDVVEGPVGRWDLVEVVVQGLSGKKTCIFLLMIR